MMRLAMVLGDVVSSIWGWFWRRDVCLETGGVLDWQDGIVGNGILKS
jgi:hypothetical protein